MRLGDLDALREDFARYTWGPYNPFARIDAAPTISCDECEYGPPPADAIGAATACLHCFCGDNFQRRQP